MAESAALDLSGVVTEETFADHNAPLPDQTTATPAAKTPVQEKPKGDAPASGGDPDSASDAPAKRRDPQKRIDQLTRRLRDAERREAYERGRREALEQHVAPKGEAQDDPKPKAEDFATTEEFADSLADWKIRHKEPAKPSGKQEPKGSTEPPREQPAAPESARKSYETAKAKYPDIDDVLFDPDIPWTRHMADAVIEEENSAEILYHLGQDEAEIERISKLSPKQQEREVWRFAEKLNAKLAAASGPGKEPDKDAESDTDTDTDDTESGEDGEVKEPRARQQPRAQVSKAAPVPSTLSGSGGGPKKSLEQLAETDFDAFDAEMSKREKARRR
ncbi:MAG: hypothetical protein ACT4O5_12600 [Gammaproteobacteria bacterium]